ncbi:MAG TPA: nucleotide disphospho-sugar-binding domain-containing protein [Thermoanaerobaculia bacterium]|nr:nucleotide disphospho-sugar-binding domain-containing protein [Thermoanaerobaculia bacterium]
MRFLFCSLDSPGFLFSAIGLASVLVRRGHEVAFVSDLETSSLLTRQGLRRLQRGAQDGHSFRVADWARPLAVAIQVKHIEHALTEFSADVMVGQCLTLGPLLVAERRQLPVAVQGLCTYLWPTTDEPAPGREGSELESRRAWRHGDLLKWLNEARARFRLPPWQGSCRDSPFLGDLFLLRSVPELQTDCASLPERVHLVGDCLWEPDESDPELETWLKETESPASPLIYVQHGRFFHVPSFWGQLVETFRRMNCRVVASVGRLDGELGALPGSFFVRPHISQGRVLRSARAVVASANSTAVLGALSAGIPSLLIPAGGEQPDVAEFCEKAGVARTLAPEDTAPERIGEALDRLLTDDRYRERACFYRSAFARVNGFEIAADLLETLAEARQPMVRAARVSPPRLPISATR